MKFKKILTLALCALLSLSALAGCVNGNNGGNKPGPDNPGTGGETQRLTVYMSGYIACSDDDAVKEAIEAKFAKDTGIKIKLNFKIFSKENFNSKFGNIVSRDTWDAAMSYLGHAGIQSLAIDNGAAIDVKSLLTLNGKNIKKVVDNDALKATSYADGQIMAIPSVNNVKTHCVLIRKDWMDKVGYTIDKTDTSKKLLRTLDDFTDMLRKFDTEIEGCDIPLRGKPYDVEDYITLGACDAVGYSTSTVAYNEDGTVKEVAPGAIDPNYKKALTYMQKWAAGGLWEKDNRTIPESTREAAWTTGTCGVYCADPEITDLIRLARLCKAEDPNAEFCIMPPLEGTNADGETVSGYKESSSHTYGLVINKKSKNIDLVVKYLDWMYSDKENYELCKYGIKGTHWEEAGDGLYTYPADKLDEYMAKPPYSGCYVMLENDLVSDRILNAYTAEELGWIEFIKSAPSYKSPVLDMLFPSIPSREASAFQGAENTFFEQVISRSWIGDPMGPALFDAQANAYRSQAEIYIEWLTKEYKLLAA